MHDTITSEWRDAISMKALKNCTPEFIDLANECAQAIAATRHQFDGSMLTMLMQKVDPQCFPNPTKTAYYRHSDRVHVECSFAAQRNYFTSAANVLFKRLALRGPKIAPQRRGTHDKVCKYTSLYLRKLPVSARCRKAMLALGWVDPSY
jgi:hypothetical protein